MPETTRSSLKSERLARMLDEVRAGLSARQKELPPKYFYDARGSRLFEEITRLPEYYLTRAERALLRARIPNWIRELRPRALVELGAGSAAKTRIILDAMRAAGTAAVYVPIDVSAAFLRETANRLRHEYPEIETRPLVADMTDGLRLPAGLPGPTLYALLGSTIGNFDDPAAVRLLERIQAAMYPTDSFLLGVDLKKEVARIEAAYNDARGVTAEFNRNILRVLNRELGADFDLGAFEHRAFYEGEYDHIEMHLVSLCDQQVTIPGAGVFRFRQGETIRTEISGKYDPCRVAKLFEAAGLTMREWAPDAEGLLALVLGVAKGGGGGA
ncbi:MAG: L-histidine N(alpha)-methyltransferase [Gemmatimonadetes bacterium]|nr:L-histidine N(alpha)-methyltransferase [Gemmatimonadota bacterium]